jgi:SAM-dependent methyltransferase
MGWQDKEKAKYDKVYGEGYYIPTMGYIVYTNILKNFTLDGIDTILDVGCGFGQAINALWGMGKKAYGIDISDGPKEIWEAWGISKYCQVASADSIPFEDNKFDLVVSVDMLEHIPCHAVQDVLKEMLRVGRHDFVFSICTEEETVKVGEEVLHVCVQNAKWWWDQISKAGYNINAVSDRDNHTIILAVKGDSKMFLQRKWINT